ncbi:MAG: zinc ribbon domain-containing protein [Desulfovibrionales bacterium]|nr:zinc ribbon domain-containing protein [Desulfovibrionales bacterium]
MPIFEYVCNACKKEFEEIVLGGADPACPACGAKDTTKLMSRGQFRTGGPIVKGSPSANAFTTRGKSSCGSCSGGNCSSCG